VATGRRSYDGKFHSVDSSDMAFQIAGGLALKEAAAQSEIVLLEPVLELEVLVPDEFVGDIRSSRKPTPQVSRTGEGGGA
jgi:translation elongation factor EF-G